MYELIKRVVHDTKGQWGAGDVTDRPCPTITVGVNSLCSSHFQIEYQMSEAAPEATSTPSAVKPPYRIPSMREVESLPWNGLNVVSTFSGTGGSCLGYRMAGFRVLWASEFIPAAQESYKANHGGSHLDTRDIRKVKPSEILDLIGMEPGQLDLLDGSPPCASFSTAGKRENGWGKVKKYSDSNQRTDDLFYEYARILRGLRPKVFIAENVSGLVKGTAKGYFKAILAELKSCGYRVEARLLDAQWLGIPQARQRLIFQGVRDDLGASPAFPSPFPYRYSVRDAIPWVLAVPTLLPGKIRGRRTSDLPCPTVMAGNIGASSDTDVDVDTSIERYAIGDEWERINPGCRSDRFFNLVKADSEKPCPTITAASGVMGLAGVVHPVEKRKFYISELKRICSFPDDFILTGSYAQQWERCGRSVPPLMMKAVAETVRDRVFPLIRG